MDTRVLLIKSTEIVTFLFAAFGGFLLKVAPPEAGGAQFGVGISSILTLCVLLYISAVSLNLPQHVYEKRWLIAAGVSFVIALSASFFYQSNFLKYTFHYPTESSEEIYFRGTTMTEKAEEYCGKRFEIVTVQDCVGDFGGLATRGRVWQPDSIQTATLFLTSNYIVVILSLATTIFCLTEGILSPRGMFENTPDEGEVGE